MKKRLTLALLGILIQTVLWAEDRMVVQCGDLFIQSPVGWLVQYTKTPNLFIMYSPLEENDTFQENGNVTVEALPGAYTVKEYMDASTESLRTVYTKFKIVETGDNFHIISGKFGDVAVQQIQFFFIRGRNAYILTFSSNQASFDRYRPVFESIAETLKFEGNLNETAE